MLTSLSSRIQSGADPCRPYACCHNFVSSLVCGQCCLEGLPSSLALTLSISSSTAISEPRGKVFDRHILFRAERSKISYALLICLTVGLCICLYLLQEEASLMSKAPGKKVKCGLEIKCAAHMFRSTHAYIYKIPRLSMFYQCLTSCCPDCSIGFKPLSAPLPVEGSFLSHLVL